MRRNYKYNVGDIISNKCGDKYEIIEQTKGKRGESAYICKCSDGHVFKKLQTKLHTTCPYCCNRIIERGVNDISTLNKSMFDMLADKDFGYTHCETSQDRTDWICPNCHTKIYNRKPYDVLHFGLKCPSCYDGISYGEKFISNLLNESGVDFIYQLTSKKADWCGNFKYDFYLPSHKCIIEVMGLQHYQDTSWGKYIDTHNNDVAKKKLALQHVDEYIELDVRKSDLLYIKDSILNSDLCQIIHLDSSTLKWEDIHKKSLSSIILEISRMYNEKTKDIHELAEKYQIASGTVVAYLNKARELGLCDYDGIKKRDDNLLRNHENNSDRCSNPVRCIQDGRLYKNATVLENESERIYGKKIDRRNVWAVCNGKQKTSHKLSFSYVTKAEFNNAKVSTPNLVYGDPFVKTESR